MKLIESRKTLNKELEALNNSENKEKEQQEQRRAILEAKINQARERINLKKEALNDLKNKEVGQGQDPQTEEAIKEAKLVG